MADDFDQGPAVYVSCSVCGDDAEEQDVQSCSACRADGMCMGCYEIHSSECPEGE